MFSMFISIRNDCFVIDINIDLNKQFNQCLY